MRTRTTYALLTTALFLATGAVAAEDATRPSATAADHPGFELAMSAHEAWTKPGAPYTFAIKAYARGDETLTLSVRAPDALRTHFEPDVLKVPAGQGARAALTVTAAEPSREGYPIVVTATDEDGNERSVRAILRVVSPDARPDEPKPYDGSALEKRIAAIVARLERIERYLGIERADATDPKVPPTAGAGVRATLATPEAIAGPDGTKVALLIQAGDHDVRLPLAVRMDEDSGWKVELEKDGIALRAGERSWLWVRLVPGDDAQPLKYAIVLKDPSGVVLAEGSASARMP